MRIHTFALTQVVQVLSCVNSLVAFKTGHVREVLSTMFTSMGFLSCVNFHVSCKVGHLRELSSTLITSIGFLSSVNSLVSF